MAGEELIVTPWKAFGSYLSDRGQLPKLREMAELISSNTNRSLIEIEQPTDPSAWLETFSGRNLGWESLAIIFIYLMLGAVASSLPREESRNLLLAYKECCSSCILWASSSGSANILLVYALYKRFMMEACIYGKASKSIHITAHGPATQSHPNPDASTTRRSSKSDNRLMAGDNRDY